MDDKRYEAICRVIDAAKNDERARDTDEYASEIVDIIEGESMRTLRIMVDVQVSPETYADWTADTDPPVALIWEDVKDLLADSEPHVQPVEVLGMTP